jgi:hypothetical protein
VVIGADRERVFRYVHRPALAKVGCRRSDGAVVVEVRHPWSDGTTALTFTPGHLVEKLIALIPPPYGHQVRYHGVLASRSAWRREVVRRRPRHPSLETGGKDAGGHCGEVAVVPEGDDLGGGARQASGEDAPRCRPTARAWISANVFMSDSPFDPGRRGGRVSHGPAAGR